MSGFNAFLGGVTAGQGAKQQQQNAFNASILSQGQQALQAEKLDQMKANRQLVQEAGAAFETGDFAGAQIKASQAGHQDFANQISKLSTQQKTQLQDEVSRKGQIAAALSSLPAEQQVIGIQTYGKEFGIGDAALAQAAANPSEALAKFSSSVRDIETMIKQSGPILHPLDPARGLAGQYGRLAGDTGGNGVRPIYQSPLKIAENIPVNIPGPPSGFVLDGD